MMDDDELRDEEDRLTEQMVVLKRWHNLLMHWQWTLSVLGVLEAAALMVIALNWGT
jgi:hypothetical protein